MNRQKVVGFTAGLLPVIVILVFVGMPLLFAILYSLGYGGGLNSSVSDIAQHQILVKHGLTVAPYAALLHTKSFQRDLWTTIWVTVLTTILLLVLAWLIAIYLRFNKGRLAKIVSSLYIVPMFIPVVIASYALVEFWNDGGILQSIFFHLGFGQISMPGFTNFGIVIGLLWTSLPFSVLLLGSGLYGVPDAYIEAARDIGASRFAIFRKVLLPMNKLPTMIVLTFTATGMMGSFTIPDIMGPSAPQMLGVAMTDYFQAFNEPQQSEVMAMLLFIGALLLSALYVFANLSENRKMGVQR